MFERNWFRKILLVVIIAAIVPSIIFGEPRLIEGQRGGDAWRNILFDFQTLIGGLLAIFAAWWTVDTMERTDVSAEARHQRTIDEGRAVERNSHARHQELVDLSQRAEKLKVERVINPQRSEVEVLDRKARQLSEVWPRIVNGEPGVWGRWVIAINSLVRDLHDVLHRPQFVGGEELFDGNLAFVVWTLRNGLAEVHPWVTKAYYFATESHTYEDEGALSFWSDDGGEERLNKFVSLCTDCLPDLIRALDKMGDLYNLSGAR
ncbi:hypothetical protein [Rhizobium sp. SL86]|uniref:hypothetical protein n=1 Tax=Rhizobium sp. SL86 TaxID=2995148 RepID=UPI002275F7BB|nr:hypothetical protein [Rhizobium sp. SL86]MCY1669318.1 hypothetical protein [Rhizobium sp. SL86]